MYWSILYTISTGLAKKKQPSFLCQVLKYNCPNHTFFFAHEDLGAGVSYMQMCWLTWFTSGQWSTVSKI